MSVDVKYRTSATATGGRDGAPPPRTAASRSSSPTPKELGGAGGPGNNPEQLFAAGYSACFLGAMKFVVLAGRAEGAGRRQRDRHCRHRAALRRRVRHRHRARRHAARPGPGATREKLVEEAHQVCPYSNATRNNVDVKLKVV